MPFENMINLQVRAFFFNSATDYLPYYKNFDISIKKDARLLDILDKIKAKNPDFSFPNKNIILKVNNTITTANITVEYVVNTLGKELKIEPANSYRSNNGLILNDDDFMESFELLAPYASQEDKAYYETLYATHYASETSNYNRQYIGDAVLLLASKMIHDGNENKEAILDAISDKFNGIRCCEYENNILNGQDHTKTIAELKSMLTLKDTASFYDKCTFGKRKHDLSSEEFTNANVALYVGSREDDLDEVRNLIRSNAASYVTFDKSTKLAGQTLMDTHFEIAHTKAGRMLLDAVDSGANVLVCTKRDVTLFQDALPSCERIMGRDIRLTIISVHTLKELCTTTV
ncbi:MAG: Unknown protein [uncultured Sulfurovum sp.]|uniref:Uncharacterized protein n=1 Tax=uncultured Sulfurovum sp. TaxID=269237 RepID=A0A6S6TJ58_9BACT|nr:MAG: Unknown protein [uncultured Sulfurovum sp.]